MRGNPVVVAEAELFASGGADVASGAFEVVHQRGRVYGVEGLRVADASIMPDCVRGNINATVMAMAERMADLIKEASFA